MLDDDFFSLGDFSFVNEEFYASAVSPVQTDALLADAWRHFGAHFFRYSFGFYERDIRRVLPLRIRLADFARSKSQRRIYRKNQDLQTVVRPIQITREKETVFARHKQRFASGAPASIYDFLERENAAATPCQAKEICVYENEKLLAASFFDVGETAVSGIYAVFEPSITARSLGIFTMLLEIDFALETGKIFYYSGYAYEGNSFYDYKKRFAATETYDWKTGAWKKLNENSR